MNAKMTALYRVMTVLAAIILILVPFHAFLSVWASTFLGHYTAVRLWKEFLLAILSVAALFALWAHKSNRQLLHEPIVATSLFYIAWVVAAGGLGYVSHQVNAKAMAYGILLDTRFVIFFLICWLIAQQKFDWLKSHWRPVLLWPALIVCLFAVAQYAVLPHDFLRHFGYGANTIPVAETINHNARFPRVQSTLRGANPLGAYLVVIVSAYAALLFKFRPKRPYILLGGLFISLLALCFSFSRSAWIGALISILAVLGLTFEKLRNRRFWLVAAAVIVVAGAALGWGLRNNQQIQNAIFHTDNKSTVARSSNDDHWTAFKSGVKDLALSPQGRGTGTAGPASVYNNHPPRIAENFFLQIGQELGVIGLVIFLDILFLVGQRLWMNRKSALALTLFVSLLGLLVVNFLSHAWADDTLAYLWWGLAGIAVVPAVKHSKTD